jgi:hypothetical protein
LLVRLHNTYWQIDASPTPSVVQTSGAQSNHPDAPGSCLPGIGCGTVERPFTAARAGTVRLTASRTSCGEAMSCTGEQGTWSVTVRVS